MKNMIESIKAAEINRVFILSGKVYVQILKLGIKFEREDVPGEVLNEFMRDYAVIEKNSAYQSLVDVVWINKEMYKK